MNSTDNSTEPTRFATPRLRGDNRSEEIHYVNDVYDLTRMASILDTMIDKAFAWSRAIKHDREQTVLTFQFSEKWVDDIVFAARDIHDRARALDARSYLLEKKEAGE